MFAKKNILVFIFSASLIVPMFAMAASFDYVPMQSVPGSDTPTSFCDYVQAVYKFGIWTVGIAAMFMIMFGGYTYLLSAGNNASMEKAKGFIFDAIAGLILALAAYLILYVINPDLVKIKIICDQTTLAPSTTPAIIKPSATNVGLHPLTSVPLATGCDQYDKAFEDASNKQNGGKELKCLLIAIANQESGCKPNSTSTAGACGMMQILPTTAGMTCSELINNPTKSIDTAGESLGESKMIIGGCSGFVIGKNFSQNASQQVQYGQFSYNTGNDDLIASYNAGPGNNTSGAGKKGPFAISSDCKTPPTPAWQCDINPGGFLETQKYVMRVQDFQKQCMAKA